MGSGSYVLGGIVSIRNRVRVGKREKRGLSSKVGGEKNNDRGRIPTKRDPQAEKKSFVFQKGGDLPD